MARMQFFILSVLVVFMATAVQAQDSCVGLPDDTLLEILLKAEVIAGGGDPGAPFSVRGGPFYTCQAQGNSNGTYRWLSVIMEYTLGTQMRVAQFEMICNSLQWSRVSESLKVLTGQGQGTDYDGSISLRTNCSSCINTANNTQHCVACDAACNDGLMRCTGSNSDDCCVAFEADDGTCSDDTECDDTNFVASQQNNFFCSCNLTSCDPGFSLITNSSGCFCVLSNICMTQPSPCNNNGSCTLNSSAPNNFTCDCTGTGFTGDTCNDLVVVSTTTSATTTTMPPSSTDTTTTSSSMTTSTPPVVTMMSPTTSTASPTSVSASPTSTPTSGTLTGNEKTALWVIIVSVIIGLILLILLIILIIYIIYYCITGRGSNLAKAKTDTPFGNGESHNNPLYLKPDEVTSEVANLYTP